MKLGDLDLGRRLILAPMAEISDSPFRIIAKEFGAGLTFTQMVSARGVIENNFDTLRLLAFNKNEKPTGVQMLGNDPGLIGEAVKEIRSFNPDLIDLNCGCPVYKVTRHFMGATILDDPSLLGRLVKAMSDAAKGIPVSVKLRLGRDKRRINVVQNAKIAEDNGASVVIVHSRTRADSYGIEPDWGWLKKVKENVSIPVVGNGSIFEPQDIIKLMSETECDSFMIARGALGNPFIFSRFNSLLENGFDPGAPEAGTVKTVALKHMELLIGEGGELTGLQKFKKHLIWYFKNFYGIRSLMEDILSINEKETLISYVNEHAEKIEKGIYPPEDLEEINRKFREKVIFWIGDEKKEIQKFYNY